MARLRDSMSILTGRGGLKGRGRRDDIGCLLVAQPYEESWRNGSATMKMYQHKLWVQYRAEQIKLHCGICAHCLRPATQVVLQVHHLEYVEGRMPWEYPYEECQVLCKGCHAKEHGIIMPSKDWKLIGEDDLGGLDGTCDYCGTELRYTHLVMHRNWGAMSVGAQCCDKLTESTIGSEGHLDYLNYIERRKTFISSKRWKTSNTGFWSIKRAKIRIQIEPTNEAKFRICLDGVTGKTEHATLLDAQISVFDFVENGEAEKYLSDRKKKEIEWRKAKESSIQK
jgi:hypothetical protein